MPLDTCAAIRWYRCAAYAGVLALAACSSVPKAPVSEYGPAHAPIGKPGTEQPALPPAGSGRGGYYQDDGPGASPPPDLLATPDAEPKIEPYSTKANRPYVALGKSYTPITDDRPWKERGIGSWYGKKFHGQRTASGEPYDMYRMTAAHPVLPIPSYARVTNLATGAQVTVRINDRGPFHSGRIIDLSYTAALKLGTLGKGSGELEVERLLPDEIERLAKLSAKRAPPLLPAPMPAPSAPVIAATSPVQGDSVQPTPAEPVEAEERDAILAMFAETDNANDAPMASDPPAGSGYYLQFGAYGQAGNAEAARAVLARSWGGDLPQLEVVQTGALFRIYGGPFASRAEAAIAARQWADNGMGTAALIVQR